MHDYYDYQAFSDFHIEPTQRYQVQVWDLERGRWKDDGIYSDWDLDTAVERCINKAAETACYARVIELDEAHTLVYECGCNEVGVIESEDGWYIEEDPNPTFFGPPPEVVPWRQEGF